MLAIRLNRAGEPGLGRYAYSELGITQDGDVRLGKREIKKSLEKGNEYKLHACIRSYGSKKGEIAVTAGNLVNNHLARWSTVVVPKWLERDG